MADIQYLNYGDLQIELLALLNALSNDVQEYVLNKPWSKKRKEKFMSAYSDLMNKGILGASNNTGQWMIDVNGVVDLDSMDKKDKEMYGEAAYFIQQKMAGLPTKASQELSKEEEKKNLPLFDNAYFTRELGNYISTKEFGGMPFDTQTDWNSLDKRDPNTGLRGRTERAATLARNLKSYADSLDESKLNFEGSPFENLNDFKTRVNNAIKALNTPDESDDTQALNAIGLRASDWFNDGSGDPVTVTLDDGTLQTITYGQLAEHNRKLEEDKAKLEALKLKAIADNYWDGVKVYNLNNFKERPLTQEESNTEYLSKLFAKDKWSGDEASLIVQAFKLAEQNGLLVPLSEEELSRLNPTFYKNIGKYLRKINGINSNLYYDTLTKLFKKFYKNGETPLTSFLDVLALNTPEALKEKQNKQLVKQMNLPIQGSLNLSDLSNFGFDEATGNELWAVINDIGAFVDPEAISGTALALNAARLRDKNREGWSWERVLDWGTSALGGLPIIGDAASVVKAGSNLVKLANRSARVGSFIGMAFSAVNMPEAWDSIKKIYDKGITSMTPQDILNITYGLMGLFAGIKTINSVNARQKPQTATEHSIEIDGKKVKLPDQATADKVSAEYKTAKNNTEASLKVIKMQEVREAAKKAGIEITDASKVTSGSGFLRGNLVSRKLGISKSPVKSKLVNTGEMTGGSTSRYYMPDWRRSFLNLEQKEIKNPLRKTFDWFLGRTPEVKSTETPKTNSTETPKTTETKSNWSLEKIDKYLKNLEQMENSFLNRDKYNPSSKSLKKIDLSKNVSPEKYSLADGKQLELSIDNGVLNIKGPDGINISLRINDQLLIKKVISDIIKNYNNSIGRSSATVKRFSKEYIESLKELRRKGYLFKQGGTIDKQKIQKYKEFIKK